jgi:two-component system phosphate regulon response regulator PhoB
MTDQPTIILAPFDPALAAELARGVPPLRSGGLDIVPEAATPVWLFVDWLLPHTSGLELCRRLRAEPRTAEARIFLVLEDDDRESRRRALKAGADDYLVGPLSAPTIRARLSEASPFAARPDAILTNGMLRLDRDAFQVRAGGNAVPMGPNEFMLLSYFMENRDRVVARDELIGALKGRDAFDVRTVDVWIGRLRRALTKARIPDPVRTVRNLGYVFDSY